LIGARWTAARARRWASLVVANRNDADGAFEALALDWARS
jgi:hypothetical protein